MSHVQAVALAAIAVLRAATWRRFAAEGWAVLVAKFSFEQREQRRRREQLRRTYADLISRLLDPNGQAQARQKLVQRLLTIELGELQKLHAECLQVAGERDRASGRAGRPANSRDALWDLTPLLK